MVSSIRGIKCGTNRSLSFTGIDLNYQLYAAFDRKCKYLEQNAG